MQLLLDERDISRLMVDYCRFVDFGEAGRVPALFTDDGVWQAAGVDCRGRDAMAAMFAKRETLSRRTSRHVITNVSIDVTGDEATAVSYLINYRHDTNDDSPAVTPAPIADPKFMGEYHDTFRRTAEGWRFASRRCDLAFLRRAAPRA
jgi:ketosteroid isomerase-like protein